MKNLLITIILSSNFLFSLSTIYDSVSPEFVLANGDAIFSGEIIDFSTRWSNDKKNLILTDYVVSIDEVLYDPEGILNEKIEDNQIVSTFAGGTIEGETSMYIPGIPSFSVGEKVIFIYDKRNLNAISPLFAGYLGVYRIKNGIITTPRGKLFKKGFFSQDGVINYHAGISYEQFINHLKASIPIAKGDPDLEEKPLNIVIPPEIRDKVYTKEDFPNLQYSNSNFSSTQSPILTSPNNNKTKYNQNYYPSSSIKKKGKNNIKHYVDEIFYIDDDRWLFQYGPPDEPTFNIPPVYNEIWGPMFLGSLGDWSRYADIFYYFDPSENTYGSNNDRNDFAFISWDDYTDEYGWKPFEGAIGICITRANFWTNIINESDIFLFTETPDGDVFWTNDFEVAYYNWGIWYARSTMVHEIGHSIGLAHQWIDDPSTNTCSVMNYEPTHEFGAEFHLPFLEDAHAARWAYDSYSITDFGIHFFYTNGDGIADEEDGLNEVYWSGISPTDLYPGDQFTITDFYVENLGTTSSAFEIYWGVSNTRFDFQTYFQTTTYSEFSSNAYGFTDVDLTLPGDLLPGTYYISAIVMIDGFDDFYGNNEAWSYHYIQVLDGCGGGTVEDCAGDGDCCAESWIGDGFADCEDQAYGCDLTCYDNDGGDCCTDLGCGCGQPAPSGCDNACGSTLEFDECGVCGGNGIPAGECDCAGNIEDCVGVCGGSTEFDECDVCGGQGLSDLVCVDGETWWSCEAAFPFSWSSFEICYNRPECTDGGTNSGNNYICHTRCTIQGQGTPCWTGSDMSTCEIPCDCDGNVLDECGVCGGDNSPCITCDDCEFDFTSLGSECCDSAWDEYGISCAGLEGNYNWDCSGCNCPGDAAGDVCGDGWCTGDEDNGSCPEDCPTCEEQGGVQDCVDDDCCPASWIGNGIADCEDQADGCDLTCYDNDGGDCDLCEWETGDINGDGQYNVLDIVALGVCVLQENCNEIQYACAADINGDGQYNVLDIVTLAVCVLQENCNELGEKTLDPRLPILGK